MANNEAKKQPSFSLKDQLFNQNTVLYLANLFGAKLDRFNSGAFVRETMAGMDQLELKARIVHIAANLENHLSRDFSLAAKQILSSLPPPLDPTRTDDDFGDFILAPLGEFVVRNGLAKKHLQQSLKLLQAITQRFSMEDAIRAFINAHPDETLAELELWSTHKNYHVRRLVSEGTRPMLPWSPRLSIDPLTPIRFLDTLYADPTRYVTRSVCNHLNDVAKSHPELVIKTLKRWQKEKRQQPAEFSWMCKHALRTLVKQGHTQALQFLGYGSSPEIIIEGLSLKARQLRAGDAVEFTFAITAKKDEAVIIDYVIEFVKSNGTLSPKVHKLKQLRMTPGETVTISKRHVLRANATTYTLYPGTHYLSLQINGQRLDKVAFELA